MQNTSQTLISTVPCASPLLPKGEASAFPSERPANAECLVEKGEVQRRSLRDAARSLSSAGVRGLATATLTAQAAAPTSLCALCASVVACGKPFA